MVGVQKCTTGVGAKMAARKLIVQESLTECSLKLCEGKKELRGRNCKMR